MRPSGRRNHAFVEGLSRGIALRLNRVDRVRAYSSSAGIDRFDGHSADALVDALTRTGSRRESGAATRYPSPT